MNWPALNEIERGHVKSLGIVWFTVSTFILALVLWIGIGTIMHQPLNWAHAVCTAVMFTVIRVLRYLYGARRTNASTTTTT